MTDRTFWIEASLKMVLIGDHQFILAVVKDITRRKLAEQRLDLLRHSYRELLQKATMAMRGQMNLTELTNALITSAGFLFGVTGGFLYRVNEANDVLELTAVSAIKPDLLSPKIWRGEGLAGQVWLSGTPAQTSSDRASADWPDIRDPRGATVCVPLKTAAKTVGVLGFCCLDEDHQFSAEAVNHFLSLAELAAAALENTNAGDTRQAMPPAPSEAGTARQENGDRYRLLFNCVEDIIYAAEITPDGLPGKIFEANEAACRTLGYTPDELRELTPTDLLPVENRTNLWDKIELLCEQHILSESALLTKTGVTVPAKINTHLAYLGDRPCLIYIVRNISERKRVEKEIARFDRLNIVGAMAAGIGHEIRNPLTTVRGFLQVLSGKKDYHKHQSYFDLMIEELDRANTIITELLSLAGNKATDLRPGNLNAIIDSLLPLLEADAILGNKCIKTRLTPIPDIPLDEKEIRQLLLNLARNGLDAMLPGSILTIQTARVEDEIVISVQDHGQGIPPNLIDKIGIPFFSTKEYGVGLGLAVCYSIAARHNATIKFDSGPTGTTFSVCFNPPE